MTSFDENLILLYQNNPCLYDKKKKTYKDAQLKANSWKEIAAALKSDVAYCQARMKCLRERYCKEKKLEDQETRSGAGKSYKQPWPLMMAMAFLDEHIKPRKTFSNFGGLINSRPVLLPSEPSCSMTESGIIEFDGVFDITETEPDSDSYSSDTTAFSPLPTTVLATADGPSTSQGGEIPLISRPSPQRRGRKRCSSPQEDWLAKHLKMVAESAEKIHEHIKNSASGSGRGETFFTQFVAESLYKLPEDIKDEAISKIMAIILQCNEKARKRSE